LSIGRRQMAVWIILPIWLTFPLIYYLIESVDRYRYPIDWTFLLTAAYGLDSWLLINSSQE